MGCQHSGPQDRLCEPRQLTVRNKRTQLIDPRKRSTKFTDIISENVSIVKKKLDRAELQFASKYLSEHEFFSSLTEPQLQEILKSMILGQTPKGEFLFEQGDSGNNFFLIYTGEVQVLIDGNVVRNLGEGKAFGELALLFRTSRTASIRCVGDHNIFFVMKPVLFRESLKKMKIFQLERNKKMIENVSIFQGLTNKQKDLISQQLKPIHFKKGDIIFKKGELANDFYIISSGQVHIEIPDREDIIVRPLDSFGENSFRYQSVRVGTAKAMEDTICCVLKKSELNSIFGRNFDNIFFFNLKKWAILRSKHFKLNNFVSSNNGSSNSGNNWLMYFISKFETKKVKANEIIVSSKPSGLVINLMGRLNGQPEGTLFCEDSYKDRQMEISTPLKMDEDGFYGYLAFDTIDKIMSDIELRTKGVSESKKNIIPLEMDKENSQQQQSLFSLSSFEFIKQLGEGQFGKVYLVKNNGFGGNYFALKCLSKQEIKRQSMEKCVIQEKRILSKIIFPYVVGFAKSFHDEKNIYFLMEYIKGKQMFDVIREMPFLNKKIATYYFACLFLSIEHLHQQNIIYRDLKPQNSVVDYTGKVFLIDMGTAKLLKRQNYYRTFTMIGTPHYMAPEILDGKGYGFQVDIWSMGILLYEFVCGCLPFGEHQTDPYAVMKIVRNQQIKYPSSLSISEDFKEVLMRLLEKNPKVRSIKASFEGIKAMKYFDGVDWDGMIEEKVEPPYIPKDFKSGSKEKQTMKLDGRPLGEFLYGRSINAKKWSVSEWNEEFEA